MSAKKSRTIKERLKTAKLAERSVQVCLRGDLAAEHDELERRLAAARTEVRTAGGEQRGTSQRMGQKSEAVKLAEQLLALRQQMADEMLDIRVRALPRGDVKDPVSGEVVREGWQTLVRRHPPKPDDEKDVEMGIDFDALMAEATPLCIVDPELDEDDWERLNNVLSSADYDRILGAVWEVNRSGVDLPKSRLASLVMAESDAG